MEKENIKNLHLKMCCCKEVISDKITIMLRKVENIDTNIPDLKFRLKMVVREMLANAIEHGCEDRNQNIDIILKASVSEVEIMVKDPGQGFDYKQVDLTTMLLMSEKGRGLGMINQAADEIEFNEDGNQITAYFRN